MADDDREAKRPVPRKPRRLLIILHGLRAAQKDVRDAIFAVREHGVEVDVRVTWEEGDTARFIRTELVDNAKEMLRSPGLTIVAAGGDGTINECAAALLEIGMPKGVSLAVLPLGTSNDFAATCNIPQDKEQALLLAADGSCIHPIDIGLLNGQVFMNTASVGASSELGAETSNEAKKAMGPAAFLVGGVTKLVSYDPVHSKLRYPAQPEGTQAAKKAADASSAEDNADAAAAPKAGAPDAAEGAQDAEVLLKPGSNDKKADAAAKATGGSDQAVAAAKKLRGKEAIKAETELVTVYEDLLHMTACNNRQIASMVQPCPTALLDDGMLDLLYLVGRTSENVAGMVTDVLTKGLTGATAGEGVRSLRVPWIEIEGDHEMPANRDGETIPSSKKFRLEVLYRKLLFHMPDDRMLVSGNSPEEGELLMPEAGTDPTGTAHSARHRHHHKHTLKDMIMRVTPFKKSRMPTWLAPLTSLVRPLATAVVGFAVGYAVSRQRCMA